MHVIKEVNMAVSGGGGLDVPELLLVGEVSEVRIDPLEDEAFAEHAGGCG